MICTCSFLKICLLLSPPTDTTHDITSYHLDHHRKLSIYTPHPPPPISTLHAGARRIFLSDCIIALPKTHWWLAITFAMNSQVPNRVDRILRWCIWSPFRHAFHPALQVVTPPSHVLGDIFALLTLGLQASAKTSCVQVHLLTFQISFIVVQLFSHV